jgi:hypothetical protein
MVMVEHLPRKCEALNLKPQYCWAPGAHASNPSYSGGREQEVRSRSQLRQIIHKTLF